ncbi:MAG: NAD(P)/FAD-dependent oxidoreductase [Amphiplicatus sp.]
MNNCEDRSGISFDIIILGDGSAGIALAAQLGRFGFRVAVLGKADARRAYEGLSERTIEVLKFLGLTNAFDNVLCHAPRNVSWNGVASSANIERLIDRKRFSLALIEDCQKSQAFYFRGRIGRVAMLNGVWRIDLLDDDKTQTIAARYLVEARGRRAPRHGHKLARGCSTISISQIYRQCQTASPGAWLTSLPNGWCWQACAGDGYGVVQVVISGNEPGLSRPGAARRFFGEALEYLSPLRAQFGAQAAPADSLRVRDVSPILAIGAAGTRSLRVGDAAYSIDPLSGHGHFEAIGGAMAAAAVINTIFNRPHQGEMAIRFYNERCANAFAHHAQTGRGFYQKEKQWPNQLFWRERREWLGDAMLFGEKKPTASIIETRPVIENDFVVERSVVVTDRHPRGAWIVDGVPVIELLKILREQRPECSVDQLANHFNVAPTQLASAAGWLVENKLL